MIVQLQRLADGKRRVTSIAEITGMEGEIIQMQEIFKYVRTGTDGDGTIQGHHVATGVRPRFLQELVAARHQHPGLLLRPLEAALSASMSFELDPLYLFYGSAALAAVLVVEALYLLFHNTKDYRTPGEPPARDLDEGGGPREGAGAAAARARALGRRRLPRCRSRPSTASSSSPASRCGRPASPSR